MDIPLFYGGGTRGLPADYGRVDDRGRIGQVIVAEPSAQTLHGHIAQVITGYVYRGESGGDQFSHAEPVEADDREILGNAQTHGLGALHGADGKAVVSRKDCGDGSVFQKMLHGVEAVFHGVVGTVDDVIGISGKVCFAKCQLIAPLAVAGDLGIDTAGDGADMGVPQFDQMAHCIRGGVQVVQQDLVHGADARFPHDTDDGDCLFLLLRQGREQAGIAALGFCVAVHGLREDDYAGDHQFVGDLQIFHFALDAALRFEGHNDEAHGGGAVQNALEDLSEIFHGMGGDHDGDHLCVAVAQIACQIVGFIVELDDGVQHLLAELFADVFISGTDVGNRGDGYACQLCHVCDVCFFHGCSVLQVRFREGICSSVKTNYYLINYILSGHAAQGKNASVTLS